MDVNSLTKIIKKKTGMRIQDFANQHLGIHYNLYRYRVINDCLRLSDYHKMILYTGLPFEKLFPMPGARQPINLTIGKPTTTTTPFVKPQKPQKPQEERGAKVLPRTSPLIKKKEVSSADIEGGSLSPHSFDMGDPFEGMMPD